MKKLETHSRSLAVGFLVLSCCTTAPCQVVSDGTMGQPGPVAAGGGYTYDIRPEYGRTVGANLFHSFSDFSIRSGEIGNFSGPDSINNVVSRVTGGNVSDINGTLSSSIPQADVYLINPSGVIFGPDATLDVQGSFHASTADYIQLQDRRKFNAVPSHQDQLLTAAPVAAFGFLGENQSSIVIDQSTLQVPEGESLSLVGGEIQIGGASLLAPAGRIQAASVNSANVVRVTQEGLETESPPDGSLTLNNSSSLDVSGDPGGTVVIRGGRLTLEGSSIRSDTLGERDAGEINLVLENELNAMAARVTSVTRDAGAGADIHVRAGALTVTDQSDIVTTTEGSGHAGNVLVEADSVLVSGDGAAGLTSISSDVAGGSTGDAGSVTVSANTLAVRDGGLVASRTFGAGLGGEVLVEADTVTLEDGGVISTESLSTGKGGGITLTADTLTIRGPVGEGMRSKLVSETKVGGDAGSITVNTNALLLEKGGGIQAFTRGEGNAGNVIVRGVGGEGTAAITLIITGTEEVTGITNGTAPFSSGNGGDIEIAADTVMVEDGGFISAATSSTGRAGRIMVRADTLAMRGKKTRDFDGVIVDFPSFISTGANITEHGGIPTGDAGDIKVKANTVTIEDGGALTAVSFGGKPGSIVVDADTMITLNDAQLGVQILRGLKEHDPSEIRLTTPNLTISGGKINALSLGFTNAGDITLNVDRLVTKMGATRATIDSYSTSGGDAGQVRIQGMDSNADDPRPVPGLVMLSDTDITTDTTIGWGAGGTISIDAAGPITLTRTNLLSQVGGGVDEVDPVTGEPIGTANITLSTPHLRIQASEINSEATSNRRAGNITLNVKDLVATDAKIFSGSVGKPELALISGGAGRVTVQGLEGSGSAARTVTLNNSEVNTKSLGNGTGGTIAVAADTSIDLTDTTISATVTDGNAGQSGNIDNVTLRAPSLRLTDTDVEAETQGAGRAGRILLEADSLVATDNSKISGRSTEGATGDAGEVIIRGLGGPAGCLELAAGSAVETTAVEGAGGSIEVTADELTLNGASISSTVTGGNQTAGSITFNVRDLQATDSSVSSSSANEAAGRAGSVKIQGVAGANSSAQRVVWTGTGSEGSLRTTAERGAGGEILVDAQAVELTGAEVSATVSGSEPGGDVTLRSPALTLTGTEVTAESQGSGRAGQIVLEAGRLEVVRLEDKASQVSSRAMATGDAGEVFLRGLDGGAAQSVALSGGSAVTTTAVEGAGGRIEVTAEQLSLDGASISSTVTDGEKAAGSITVTADNLTTINQSEISSESKGAGAAGDIRINFEDTFLTHASTVSTNAEQSDGGNIVIDGGRMMRLRDDSAITTSVTSGDSTGGNIDIQARFVILDSSTILANAFGGPGGTIRIQAEAFIPSGDSLVEAVGKASQIPGTIEILAPDTDFLKSLAPLTAVFEDPGSKLGDRCSQRRDVDQSTFSTAVRDGMPLGPEAFLLGAGMSSDIRELDGATLNWDKLEINPELLAQAGLASVPCQ